MQSSFLLHRPIVLTGVRERLWHGEIFTSKHLVRELSVLEYMPEEHWYIYILGTVQPD